MLDFHLGVRRHILSPAIFTNVRDENYIFRSQFAFQKIYQFLYMTTWFIIFLDPACQELDLDHHCYKFDPYCSTKKYIKTRENFATTSIVASFLGLFIPIAVLFLLYCYCGEKQRRRRNYGKLNYSLIKRFSELLISTNPSQYGWVTSYENVQYYNAI